MYLSKISIDNYKGIERLETSFTPDINIIIGENGCHKSALIDAIRLLYNLGEPLREIAVSKEDFHEKAVVHNDGTVTTAKSDLITIAYEFRGLSPAQKGAFYEYMVVDQSTQDNDYARIELQYRMDDRYPIFSYSTGNIDGQKADTNTFRLFQHYYLSALRDSTKDLLNARNNILGKVIKRLVDRNNSEDEIKEIVKEANDKLLERDEVKDTKTNINDNLDRIFKHRDTTKIGLHIEQSKIEFIVNIIKPYLPFNSVTSSPEGFQIWQNSLGFNNLIYIATVLGDIKERIADDDIPHFTLLIEEPEAHIHPQLQLSLYGFLKGAIQSVNSQLFITSHSPTLTSKVPLKNLILLDSTSFTIESCFKDRAMESLMQDTVRNLLLTDEDIEVKRKQLERYLDVSKSQLFFAKSCLFVEGISEELLVAAFCQVLGFNLEDYRIEMVNVDGTSFYPFLFLFNSSHADKRLPKKVAVLTDGDHFPSATKKEYSLDKLIENNYILLKTLHTSMFAGSPSSRVANLTSVKNRQSNISIHTSQQTFEYELCLHNIGMTKTLVADNFLYQYLKAVNATEVAKVDTYISTLPNETLSLAEQQEIAILLWKCMHAKAEFAQDFSIYIAEKLSTIGNSLIIPPYIKAALTHLQ